jgi:hypothetical protein
MGCNGPVSFVELHITKLPFPKIFKDAICAVTVCIRMLKPLFTRDDNH